MTQGAKSGDRPIRERDRYRRASLSEQLGDALRSGARNPRALLVVLVIVGGWAFFQLTTPRVVQLADLTVGACLHVPTASNANIGGGQVGSPAAVASVMAGRGADVAGCDASHSHEVAGVFTDADAAGAPYPSQVELTQRHLAACQAAFASYVGHPVDGSTFELTVVVQTEAGWNGGRRAGACLVSSADGTFLSSRAGGSGR